MSRSGSIKKDASDRWYFIIDVPAPTGERRQIRRRGFKSEKAAERALIDTLTELRTGTYVEPSKLTFGTYLTRWLDGLAAAGRKPSTIDSYRRAINAYVIKDDVALLPVQKVTALDLDRLYSKLIVSGRRNGGPLSLRTVRYLHTIISKALSDAERKETVTRNVARLATPPAASAAKAPDVTVWTSEQLRAFLEVVDDHHHGALFRVAAMTGLRRAELCGLRWVDVELDQAELVVRQSITTVNHVPTVTTPKTSRSRRRVNLDPGTVARLRRHRTEQLEQRMLMGAGWTDHGLVFAMPDGSPWNPDVITRRFTLLIEKAGLPRIRFHDLRHTHASHLLAAGTNIKVVSERLGHSSVSFTLDVYAHVMPGQQADAAAAVAAMVDGL